MTVIKKLALRSFLILTACFLAVMMQGQSFADLISRLNALPAANRQAVADSFMNSGHFIPFIEYDTLVHFVYNAPAVAVSVAGDATGWNPDKYMTHVNGCNFHYYTTSYESDARLDYKLVIDSANWILDPKNPNTCSGGYGQNSELRMPGYTVPPEISYYSTIQHGTLRDTTFHSVTLGNSRLVRVYLPPGYPSGSTSYPVILFHDGIDYINLCNTPNILDYLISQHLISPVIGVFVPPVDRTAEYAGGKIDLFTSFIVNELMPVIDARYKTSREPSKRAVAGASDGGNISLYIGMKHPEQFGKICAQSSDVQSVISSTFSTGPKLNLSLYIDIGTYDIGVLIPMVHGLRDILQSKGYDFQYREWHEGHSWGNWKGHLRIPLMQFFPYASGLNETPPADIRLGPNKPNPFRGQTTIPFFAPAGSDIELSLFDMKGVKIETLFSGIVNSEVNSIKYRHHKPSGQFIVTLSEGRTTRRSIIINAL